MERLPVEVKISVLGYLTHARDGSGLMGTSLGRLWTQEATYLDFRDGQSYLHQDYTMNTECPRDTYSVT